MIFSENRHPPPELGCSRVLALLHGRKSETSELRWSSPRLFRDHALGACLYHRPIELLFDAKVTAALYRTCVALYSRLRTAPYWRAIWRARVVRKPSRANAIA